MMISPNTTMQLEPTYLTHFMPQVSFYTPWKHQKTKGFLMFPGVIERDQWHEMSEIVINSGCELNNPVTTYMFEVNNEDTKQSLRKLFRSVLCSRLIDIYLMVN